MPKELHVLIIEKTIRNKNGIMDEESKILIEAYEKMSNKNTELEQTLNFFKNDNNELNKEIMKKDKEILNINNQLIALIRKDKNEMILNQKIKLENESLKMKLKKIRVEEDDLRCPISLGNFIVKIKKSKNDRSSLLNMWTQLRKKRN